MKGKSYFIKSLEKSPDKKDFIKRFCEQYSYFSQNQIIAFSKLLQLLPPTDNNALALVANVIYDELGQGDPAGVHSVLFATFAKKFKAATIPDTDVVPGVKNYVAQLDQVFSKGPLSSALATYWFLEKSAVETYAPVLQLLRNTFPELNENDLKFFILHAEMEPEHEKAALQMNERFLSDGDLTQQYEAQVLKMETYWDEFWDDITTYCLK